MAATAALTASAALKARVRRPSLLKKLAHPEDLIPLFPNGAYIGWSGFTGVGYPKVCVQLLNCWLLKLLGSFGWTAYSRKVHMVNSYCVRKFQRCSQIMSRRMDWKAN